jgi:hemerythrin-like domain-containing protein
MKELIQSRRGLLRSGVTALGLPLAACSGAKGEKEVGAVEDLMREHGVLRRALLIYEESATKLVAGATLDPAALNQTASLFRAFGEDYHERKLEEAYIFPRLKKAGGKAGALVDVLLVQHQRGREITDFILARTGGHTIDGTLAHVLQSFVLMYQNHAAREDTIIFPAWKAALSDSELDELGDKFEDIEKQQFGADGFQMAVDRISAIEGTLGFSDLAQFTPPPPPGG